MAEVRIDVFAQCLLRLTNRPSATPVEWRSTRHMPWKPKFMRLPEQVWPEAPLDAPSGTAVSRLAGVKDVFKLDGFDHAFSYQDEIAQHTVLYAIGKMVQEIQLKEDGTCDPCEPS